MANRKATFAKRQREADLKDRAKQKEDRRTQKRTEVRDSKGPQIAWDEAVHAVTSDELPPVGQADQDDDGGDDAPDVDDAPTPPASPLTSVSAGSGAAPKPVSGPGKTGPVATKPTASSGPASPRGVG